MREEIAAHGPMPVARFMALALGHPEHGYYMTRDPLGRSGDFITAPEISQMFGEMLGLWLAALWQAEGAPQDAILAELGPGRGSLMADVARVFAGATGRKPPLWLVETSPVLQQAARARLEGWDLHIVPHINDLPQSPLFLVANEFFDALPVHQFQKLDAVWAERCLDWREDTFTPVLRRGPVPPLDPRLPDGAIHELCPAAKPVMAGLGARIAAHGGAALIVDYGDWQGSGDTLQAVAGHERVPPFEAPGQRDLTAHVRFADLAAMAPDLAHGFAEQGAFLAALGIGARAEALARGGDHHAIADALDRLTGPDAMGRLFKVLGLARPGQPLPGLAPLPKETP